MQILNLKFQGSLKEDDPRWQSPAFCATKVAQNPAYIALIKVGAELEAELMQIAFKTALAKEDARGLYIVLRTLLSKGALNLKFALSDEFVKAMDIMSKADNQKAYYEQDFFYQQKGDYCGEISLDFNFFENHLSKANFFEIFFYKMLKRDGGKPSWLHFDIFNVRSKQDGLKYTKIVRWAILLEKLKQEQEHTKTWKSSLTDYLAIYKPNLKFKNDKSDMLSKAELSKIAKISPNGAWGYLLAYYCDFKEYSEILELIITSKHGLEIIAGKNADGVGKLLAVFDIELKASLKEKKQEGQSQKSA